MDELYPDIAEAVRQRRKELGEISDISREKDLYLDIAETARQRSKEVKGASERSREDDLYADIAEAVRLRSKQFEEAAEVSKEIFRFDTMPEIAPWKGAWLGIFIFFLVITLTMTSLSLLFGGPSPFGTYLFFWVILALLVIIYPVVQIIDRWPGRHSNPGHKSRRHPTQLIKELVLLGFAWRSLDLAVHQQLKIRRRDYVA